MKRIRKLVKNQKGQGMLEYVMLLAVVAVIVLAFKEKIRSSIDTLTGQVTSKASSVIEGQ